MKPLKYSEVKRGPGYQETDYDQDCKLIVKESDFFKVLMRLSDFSRNDENSFQGIRWSKSGEKYDLTPVKCYLGISEDIKVKGVAAPYTSLQHCRVTDEEFNRLLKSPTPKQEEPFELDEFEKAFGLNVAQAKAARKEKHLQYYLDKQEHVVNQARNTLADEMEKYLALQNQLQEAKQEVARQKAQPLAQQEQLAKTSPKPPLKAPIGPAPRPPTGQAPKPPMKGGSNDPFYQKYLKYKTKYMQLLNSQK